MNIQSFDHSHVVAKLVLSKLLWNIRYFAKYHSVLSTWTSMGSYAVCSQHFSKYLLEFKSVIKFGKTMKNVFVPLKIPLGKMNPLQCRKQ